MTVTAMAPYYPFPLPAAAPSSDPKAPPPDLSPLPSLFEAVLKTKLSWSQIQRPPPPPQPSSAVHPPPHALIAASNRAPHAGPAHHPLLPPPPADPIHHYFQQVAILLAALNHHYPLHPHSPPPPHLLTTLPADPNTIWPLTEPTPGTFIAPQKPTNPTSRLINFGGRASGRRIWSFPDPTCPTPPPPSPTPAPAPPALPSNSLSPSPPPPVPAPRPYTPLVYLLNTDGSRCEAKRHTFRTAACQLHSRRKVRKYYLGYSRKPQGLHAEAAHWNTFAVAGGEQVFYSHDFGWGLFVAGPVKGPGGGTFTGGEGEDWAGAEAEPDGRREGKGRPAEGVDRAGSAAKRRKLAGDESTEHLLLLVEAAAQESAREAAQEAAEKAAREGPSGHMKPPPASAPQGARPLHPTATLHPLPPPTVHPTAHPGLHPHPAPVRFHAAASSFRPYVPASAPVYNPYTPQMPPLSSFAIQYLSPHPNPGAPARTPYQVASATHGPRPFALALPLPPAPPSSSPSPLPSDQPGNPRSHLTSTPTSPRDVSGTHPPSTPPHSPQPDAPLQQTDAPLLKAAPDPSPHPTSPSIPPSSDPSVIKQDPDSSSPPNHPTSPPSNPPQSRSPPPPNASTAITTTTPATTPPNTHPHTPPPDSSALAHAPCFPMPHPSQIMSHHPHPHPEAALPPDQYPPSYAPYLLPTADPNAGLPMFYPPHGLPPSHSGAIGLIMVPTLVFPPHAHPSSNPCDAPPNPYAPVPDNNPSNPLSFLQHCRMQPLHALHPGYSYLPHHAPLPQPPVVAPLSLNVPPSHRITASLLDPPFLSALAATPPAALPAAATDVAASAPASKPTRPHPQYPTSVCSTCARELSPRAVESALLISASAAPPTSPSAPSAATAAAAAAAAAGGSGGVGGGAGADCGTQGRCSCCGQRLEQPRQLQDPPQGQPPAGQQQPPPGLPLLAQQGLAAAAVPTAPEALPGAAAAAAAESPALPAAAASGGLAAARAPRSSSSSSESNSGNSSSSLSLKELFCAQAAAACPRQAERPVIAPPPCT